MYRIQYGYDFIRILAAALARADVGIAIGAGTDIAIESADIVLMKSDLMDAVKAIQLSKAVIRNIKQNLFWAFFYNAIGIPLAAGGILFLADRARVRSGMRSPAGPPFSSQCGSGSLLTANCLPDCRLWPTL